jgi:hypothetical protein
MGTPCPAAINEGRKLVSSSIDRRAFSSQWWRVRMGGTTVCAE